MGAVLWGGATKTKQKAKEEEQLLEALNIKAVAPPPSGSMSGDPLRIGIIGFGIRGKQLCRALGFANQLDQRTS